jgi:hypothetical protein
MYIRMPSLIYQNMVNLIAGFPIRRRPSSIFMDVAMWEHRTFDSEVFTCVSVYCSHVNIIANFVFRNVFSAYIYI